MDDDPLFSWSEVTMFNPWPEIISPSQSTTFTAPHQSYIHKDFNMK